MKKELRLVMLLSGISILVFITYLSNRKYNLKANYSVGQAIDSLNGVKVYYNGGVGNIVGRHVTKDKYNLGLKYQCVEFVKRYYYEHLHHKMPDSYGNAKDFFDKKIGDGEMNKKRGLLQFSNPSLFKPRVNDLLVLSETGSNPYGHVAIISEVNAQDIEIIQQNPGTYSKSRVTISLKNIEGKWMLLNDRVLGWLRKGK